MRYILCLSTLLLLCNSAHAVFVTFNPDSAFIRHGGFADVVTSTFDPGQLHTDFNSPATRILIRDDSIFGIIPLGSTIDSAVLELDKTEGSDGNVSVHQILTAWDEASVTWNSFNGGGVAGVDYVVPPATVYAPGISDSGVNSIDVTSIVQAWSSGETNQGFYLVNDGMDGVTYRSSDATVGLVPKLAIHYSTASVPEPTSFLLFGLLASVFGLRKLITHFSKR